MTDFLVDLTFDDLLYYNTIIALFFTFIFTKYLHKKINYSKRRIAIFLFAFIFSLPLVGVVLALWFIYYITHIKYGKQLHDTQTINLDEFSNEFVDVKRIFGEGSMRDLIANDYAPTSLKMKALVALSDNITKENITIFKHALSSSDDEVRLFCFSIIDNLERDLNTKIYDILKKYNALSDGKQKADYAKQLAYLYWELVYFELSDDVLKNFIIDESLKYVQEAIVHNFSDTDLHVLLGKIYLEKRDYDSASTEFTFAIELDEEKLNFILPYLAEIHFNNRNYRSVHAILCRSRNLELNSTLGPIVDVWKCSA